MLSPAGMLGGVVAEIRELRTGVFTVGTTPFACAGQLSTKASELRWNALGANPSFSATPQPTPSTTKPVESARPTPPPTAESWVLEVWVKPRFSGGCVPPAT